MARARSVASAGEETEVLIAGAGPTGLVLALWLTRLGVKVRIVDKAAKAGTTSRAVAVQARTLEFYRQIGLADTVVAAGRKVGAMNLWVHGRPVTTLDLHGIGRGLSPYDFMFIFPQDQHEALLISELDKLGVRVERAVELAGFSQEPDGVRAVLRDARGREEACRAAYLAGCDGARSRTREVLGARFPGGTYQQLFYVADVSGSGPGLDGDLHIDLDEADFLALFPLQGRGRARLIGTVRGDKAAKGEALTFKDVSDRAIRSMKLKIGKVNWFSTYHVHHRVADRFREGRVFLAGDAAHIHSPAGGQGMNTGIGDAVNLAWKLAAVVRGRAPEALLDSYEPERIGFARRLVATTDRIFAAASAPGRLADRIRTTLVPWLAPGLTGLPFVRRFAFRTVSQMVVNYRHGPLARGAAGDVWGGDRLPWVRFADGADNFAPLASLDWQVHVYGEPAPALVRACAARRLQLCRFGWEPAIRHAGLKRGALYLVRPDGYVALADPRGGAAALQAFLDARDLAPPA